MRIAKRRLFAGSLLSSLVLIPAVAAAQSSAEAQAGSVATSVGEVVVTGSRIPRPNLEQPTPITTINAVALENFGASSLGDALAQLPALASSGTARANSDGGSNRGGLSFPDLRGLGTSRTLTLVNGKRHVSGDAGDTAVDLNTIPIALVDRVEVVTGGASAIYGSDAVSGVINIILKDRFQGFEFGVQGGGPMNGEYGENYSAYGTGGWNFAGDRGNVTLTVFGDKQERVRGSDVKGLKNWATVANPLSEGPADGVVDRIFKPYVQTEYFSPNGNLIGANTFNALAGFDAAGDPRAIPPRTGVNNFYYGSHDAPCDVCDPGDQASVLVPRQRQYGVAGTLMYEFNPNLRFRADLKYVDSKLIDTFSSSFTTFQYLLDPDNAFITPAIQAVLDANPEEQGFFYVNRVNDDIGGRNDYTRRKTFRGVFALEGDFDASFADVTWEASYNYGRTRNKFHSVNGLIPGNFLAAVDAVQDPSSGEIRCRKDVPSAWYDGYLVPDSTTLTNETCVPFNLFGQQNSQAAVDYVTFEADRSHTITQQVVGLTFNLDTSRVFTLPGGPVALAGGLEYREERSRNINDPFVQSGITEIAPQPNAEGGFNVREAFLEFDAPLLRDAPWAYRLSVNGAVRLADYSHAGNATAYKAGGVWAPVRDLSFRGTFSRAVRAPNITEAFLPATSGFDNIFDPCDINSIDERSTRRANCAALGVTFDDAADTNFPGVTSGNRDLKPEKAETWTVGFVLQPRWVPGLALTVDYYDIVIKDAISFLNPQDAADKCVDGPELAEQYCSLILRDPATAQILSYRSSYLNQTALKTAGYDIQVSYSHDMGDWTQDWGRLSRLDGVITGSLNANYVEKLRQFAFQDFPDEVDRIEGEISSPRWSFVSSLTYQQGPVSLTWNSQFLDKVRRNKDISKERYDRPYVNSVWYQDFIARYRFTEIGEGAEVYVGVKNAFNEKVPIGITGNTNSNDVSEADYDIYGRYLFAGFKGKF
ncbi:TonB-dependent receptor [Phenylobacterium sp. LjRoot225]|uniref:TonB-dependent receptor plug domain-containing protein n=1 Tax=Phenylobacterium sp. LjRoot225 TaxID=3342285 RepID=UPI003ED10B23